LCLLTGAVVCEWLLLLAVLAGACYVVARSPPPTLAHCRCVRAESRTSRQRSDCDAHNVGTVSDTARVYCRSSHDSVVSIARKVLFYTATCSYQHRL